MSEARPAYARYVLGSLTMVCTWSLMDRGLMMLLLQPIKEDLQLSDTQMGFLTGIAFGLFYATLGLPLARWADRGNRVTLASLAIGLWGCTVMACVFVTNFAQLVWARIAAAVGEAGCMPPTYSLAGDYFPDPAERVRAMSVYWLAGPLAALISFGLGGWLNQHYGWRAAFFVMGLPGLAIAVLIKTTVAEPRASALRAGAQSRQPAPRMRDVLRALWGQRASRHLSLAIILLFTMGYGLAPWYAAFLMRSHGFGSAELGVWLGLIFGLGGIAGTAAGGYIAARWFANDERIQMRLSAVTIASLVPFFAAFLLVPGKLAALLVLTPLIVALSFFFGPAFALLQRLVVDDMRATTLALVMLFANLIGMGLGPQIVGALSDAWRPTLGTDSLRYAMLTMSLVAAASAWQFWKVGETLET